MDLRREAAAHGVAVAYHDWLGNPVEVSDQTLAAVLAALGDRPRPQAGEPFCGTAPIPGQRAWGFTVQLYAVRSRGSWGHGDFRDLADLARWSRTLGAGFVLVNPLHAAEPSLPVSPSPYQPMTRRFLSPLYLRIEDVPGYQQLTTEIDALAAPLRAVNASAALIDRNAVWEAKRAALTLLHTLPVSAADRASMDAFRAREGKALEDWATWCAIAERHGADWRAWPAALRTPGSAAVENLRAELADRAAFHQWLQWLAAGQAAAAHRAAVEAGMTIGVIADLAVGSHPGGADTWAGQDVFAPGVSVGAPPDEFNQLGQDWTLRPWHPGVIAAQGGRPLAELTASAARHAGGLRIDHVMGLSRLWWIPEGMSPAQGTYVRYDHELLSGVIARTGVLAIGEDLGTVEPWLPGYLDSRGILGTNMLWFEREPDGSPTDPACWRRNCLATVGTHDMPPAAAFWSGEQVTLRASLGLLTRPEAEERLAAQAELARLAQVLSQEGNTALSQKGNTAQNAADFTTALYAYLARTPALLIGISLAEAAGQTRPQNVPGTTDQYPNWRIPLTDNTGEPVLLEDLPARADVLAIVSAVNHGAVNHGAVNHGAVNHGAVNHGAVRHTVR